MSMEHDGLRERVEQADDEAFRVSGVEVSDRGRVRIPSRFRERHGIEEDDIIDLRVLTADHQFWTLDLVTDDRGRVRIPSRKRDIYDIEDGEVVAIDVIPQGVAVEDL